MRDSNGGSAILNFLLQKDGAVVQRELSRKDKDDLAKCIFDKNKLFELSKNEHPTHALKIDGTDISVSFKKGESIPEDDNEWIVLGAERDPLICYDQGSNIKRFLRGKIIATDRNRHNDNTKADDWLATIAFYLYITEQDLLRKFLSFLAAEYDIILNNNASDLLDAILKIITMKEKELYTERKIAVCSSIPLFIQAERAKALKYEVDKPQTIALFSNNLDKFSVKKTAINFIEEIERASAESAYEKTFDTILNDKIDEKEINLLDKSVLEGIRLARSKDMLFDEKTDIDPITLLNPDVDAYFYEIIKCVTAFSSMNNVSAKNEFLRKLEEYAKDFSVIRRPAQERAVLTLFYILHECFEIASVKRRREIFNASCSKVTYALVDRLFDALNVQSGDFYIKIVQEAYENAIKGESPLYFFYYHKVITSEEDEFVYLCHKFRADTREGGGEIRTYIDTAKIILQAMDDIERREGNKYLEDKKYIYAMHSLLYALANISLISIEGKNSVLKLVEEYPKILQRLIVVDYLTRKGVFGERSDDNDGELTKFIRSGKFFLLCGPTRLVCSLSEKTPKVSLNDLSINYQIKKDNLISDYQKWLTAEEGRYKILLARLLSIIDGFDYHNQVGNKHCLLNCRFFNESDFLSYDNVDVMAVNKAIIDIKGQYLK